MEATRQLPIGDAPIKRKPIPFGPRWDRILIGDIAHRRTAAPFRLHLAGRLAGQLVAYDLFDPLLVPIPLMLLVDVTLLLLSRYRGRDGLHPALRQPEDPLPRVHLASGWPAPRRLQALDSFATRENIRLRGLGMTSAELETRTWNPLTSLMGLRRGSSLPPLPWGALNLVVGPEPGEERFSSLLPLLLLLVHGPKSPISTSLGL